MNCTICGNQMVDDFTTFTVMRENAVYVTEEAPCLKCSVCEHVVFTQAVAKELERYSSGRRLPTTTFRTWVFKWGVSTTEIPRHVFPSSYTDVTPVVGILGTY